MALLGSHEAIHVTPDMLVLTFSWSIIQMNNTKHYFE